MVDDKDSRRTDNFMIFSRYLRYKNEISKFISANYFIYTVVL